MSIDSPGPSPRKGLLQQAPRQAHAQAREAPADDDGRSDRPGTAHHALICRRGCRPLQCFLFLVVFVTLVHVRIHARTPHQLQTGRLPSRTVDPALPQPGAPASLAMQRPAAATRMSQMTGRG